MRAVILAGGKGTRLYPYTTIFPKPLVPLDDTPILEIIIRQLAHYGFKDIVLSVGYLSELIQAYFLNSKNIPSGVRLKYVKENKPLGTSGSVAKIRNLKNDFLVMNGDILTTMDYRKLFEFHKKKKATLTIAMHRRQVKIDLGLIDIDKNAKITSFTEKPTMKYLVSMGIYVYSPEVLKYIKPDEHIDFPDLVWRLLAQKERVYGWESGDYWLDLGSHDDYARALEEFHSRKKDFLF